MSLPIEEARGQVLEPFEDGVPWRMLVKAPTGSGKSTCLPGMLLDVEVTGLIVVVQPRRLAARMLAKRVASMRGSSLGGEVGYVVRFEHKMTDHTRIVYVTDGMLQRWLEENPLLKGIGAVVFDEFHERRLAMDIALGDCLNLQETKRSDLRVCVMSATLELEGLEEYIAPCRLVEVGGRSYPVDVTYQKLAKQGRLRVGRQAEEPVWEKALRALNECVKDPDCGNILIFMPGVYEIRRTIALLENRDFRGWEVCPLYGALSPAQQDLAVREAGGSRIIVSTNVAETSLTIPGVRTVIDAGLARVATFDAVRGVDTLLIQKIARSAADQRAGRAGRTAPGKCVRLWSEADHARRDAFERAEVARVDLTETVLKLRARGMDDVFAFRWLEKPTEQSLTHANALLASLGATENDGVSELGLQIARLPLHPRVGRLLLAAHHYGCLAEAVFVAVLIQGEALFMRDSIDGGRDSFVYDDECNDFATDWRAYSSAKAMAFQVSRCHAIGVLARAAKELERGMQVLTRQTERLGWRLAEVDFSKNSKAFRLSMLAAFADQLAVRNGLANLSCKVVGARAGQISKGSSVKLSKLFVTTSITEVGARDVTVYLNGCVGVELEDLRELFPAELEDKDGAYYDEKIRRVVNRKELRFRDLVITAKEGGAPCEEEAVALLAQRVASGELKLKKWDATVEQWIARLLSLGGWMPELELPGFDEGDKEIVLESVCQGALGYKQIKDKPVQPVLDTWLSVNQHASLNAYAPERIKLENGVSVKVKYEYGKPPQIALKVQQLYGVHRSPTIANGKITVQIHICAPNQRPWQMTQDLENFWKSGFQQMKKDLAGRYPKHDWSGGGHVD